MFLWNLGEIDCDGTASAILLLRIACELSPKAFDCACKQLLSAAHCSLRIAPVGASGHADLQTPTDPDPAGPDDLFIASSDVYLQEFPGPGAALPFATQFKPNLITEHAYPQRSANQDV